MDQLKGIIALDIDGTLTHDPKILHGNVQSYLQFLMHQGWQFIFLTGRSFSFAWPILASFQSSFFLGCQNGAQLFELPSRRTLFKHYLNRSDLEYLEKRFNEARLPLVIESGYDHGDRIYYKAQDFATEELKQYLAVRKSLSSDQWTEVRSFADLPIDEFAIGKYFSKEKAVFDLPFHTCTLRDPFRSGHVLTHISDEKATKDHIVQEFWKKFPKIPLIAAGDDYNDFEMLRLADVKIVPDHAPKALKEIADIVTTTGEGMITALQEAFKRL